MNVMKAFFPYAKSHLCLEHAKRNADKRFTGGYRHVVTNFVDSMAFQGPMAFSVAVDAFLESLHEDNQDTVYFTSARAGGAFIATGTVWSAPWQSNYAVCTPGYSTFIPQTAETGWAVEDIIFGDSRHFTTDQLVVNTQRRMKQLVGDQVYENVFHKPMGPNVHQGSLVRGDGLNQPKTGCHDT